MSSLLAVAGLLIQLDNVRFFPRLARCANSGEALVDVCVAMRNEARTAEPCCHALLRQKAVRRVFVVDDGSTDQTYEVLRALMLAQPRLSAAKAIGSGKCAALAQAAAQTQAEMLFFTDADVVAHDGALNALLCYANDLRVDAVSVWPRIMNHSIWDALLCPAITLFLVQALPMRAALGTDSRFSAANGQALLVRRAAYNAAGGHGTLRTIVEDVELAIHLKRAGYKVALASGAALFSAAGYGSFARVYSGLGRSLYFAVGPFGAASFGMWQCLAFLTPWVAVCLGYRSGWIGVAASLAARTILAVQMRHAWFSVALTPLCGALAATMGFSAALTGATKGFYWRGRRLATITPGGKSR